MLNISFFSYKGGAGRTSLLFNTLPYIAESLNASEREPIVVIDLDIDSRGLTYLVDKECEVNSVQVLKGEIANNPRMSYSIAEHPFFSKLCGIGQEVGLPISMQRAILFIPAPKNSFLGASNNDAPNVSLKKLKELCQRFRCKALVMDTPAGSQLSGEQALSISNKIVTVMRITKQFSVGTYDFLKNKCKGFSGKEFIIVPNAVPLVPLVDGKPRYDIDKIMGRIARNATSALNEDNDLNLTLLENEFRGVNEVNSFKFTELSLRKEEKERDLVLDEIEAMKMFKIIAEEIVK